MLGGQVGTRASGFPEVRGLGDGVGPVQLKRFGQAGGGCPWASCMGRGAVATQRDNRDKCSHGWVHILRIPCVIQCSWREPGSQ